MANTISVNDKSQAYYATDANKNPTGLVNPQTGGTMNLTAASLVSSYDAMQQENQLRGNYLEPRAGLTAADTPTLSASTTIPSSDPTDPASQRISLFGTDLSGVSSLSKEQMDLGKRWIRGFSSGAYGTGFGNGYRLSSTMRNLGSAGNQGTRPSDNYGFDANNWYSEVILDGDVLYFRTVSGLRFSLFVNDNFISTTATLGTGVSYSAVNQTFETTLGGGNWVKVKFSTVERRKIRIGLGGASALGDFFTRGAGTIIPAYQNPVEWIHFGDSFSQGTGATSGRTALTEYMAYEFGRDINFINTSQGASSFAGTDQNFPNETQVNGQKGSFYLNYYSNWKFNNPKIITCLVGHNDTLISQTLVSSRVATMFTDIRNDFPDAIIVVFTSNSSLSLIASGNDVLTENTIINTIKSLGLGIYTIPMQTNPYGSFLRGTGKVGTPTGVGNSDIYVNSDGTHPSPAGHKATGLWMAERLYEILKNNMLY